jgi:hypothetical protein
MAGVPSVSHASLGSSVVLPPVPASPPAIVDRASRLDTVGVGRARPAD